MDAQQLLNTLAERQIRLVREGDGLTIKGARQALTQELIEAIKLHKPRLLEMLESIESSGQPATTIQAFPLGQRHELSPAQLRLWALQAYNTSLTAYNISVSLLLKGPMAPAALETALNQLVARHAILRTVFPSTNGEPYQQIQSTLNIPLPLEDLRPLDPQERESRLKQAHSDEANHIFDLAVGPLIRAALFWIAEDQHILMLNLHHIISDGISSDIIRCEIEELYRAALNGTEARLDPLPYQYAHYARWQTERLQELEAQGAVSWWQTQLQGSSEHLALPLDHPYPAPRTDAGAAVPVQFDAAMVQALNELATAKGCTAFAVAFTAYAVLLHRLSDQTDLVVGVPVANRPLEPLQKLIGTFVNTLPVRVTIDAEPSFEILLDQVASSWNQALAHGEVPLERIVRAVDPPRNPAYQALFQTLFVWEHHSPKEKGQGSLQLSVLPSQYRAAKYDLNLNLSHRGDAIEGYLVFSLDILDHNTAGQWRDHYLCLLEAALNAPQRPIDQLPLMTAAAQTELLASLQAKVDSPLRNTPLTYQSVEAALMANPQRTAILQDSVPAQVLSAGELLRRVQIVANGLASHGIGPEDVVALNLPRSIGAITTILATMRLGAAFFPIDPQLPWECQVDLCNDVGVQLVVSDDDTILRNLNAPCVRVQHLNQSKHTDVPPREAHPLNLAYLLSTSGSTGKPKQVMITQRSMAHFLAWKRQKFPLGAEDVLLQKSPLYFDAFVFEIFAPLIQSAALVLARPNTQGDADYLINAVRRYRVTHLKVAASVLPALLEHPEVKVLKGLKRLFAGAEKLPKSTAQICHRKLGFYPINVYGPTEITVNASVKVGLANTPGSSVPLGIPLPNTQILVTDPKLALLPTSFQGQLVVGGVGLARGYHNQAALTAATFVPNPFCDEPGSRLYLSGDLGRQLTDRNFLFHRRADHQFKLNGIRVEAGHVETALNQHAAVAQSLVLIHQGETKGAHLAALYTLRPGAVNPNDQELRQHLLKQLSPNLIPARFILLEELPRFGSGKLDRQSAVQILAQHTHETRTRTPYIAPRGEDEAKLAKIWCDLLKLERVGIHDNFFTLGGDSIVGIQVAARARDLGLHLSPADLFKAQTIAQLAQLAKATPQFTTDQGAVTGKLPLTPIQARFFQTYEVRQNRYTQAVLLDVAPDLTARILEQALAQLVDHHDGLRVRFPKEGQPYHAKEAPFEFRDVICSDEAADRLAVETSRELEDRFDLEAGPLLAAALIRSPQTHRVLITIHHLLVDNVSWRILLEDLALVCRKVTIGSRATLPLKTTSYAAWARRLCDYAAKEKANSYLNYWQEQTADKHTAILAVSQQRDSHGLPTKSESISVQLDSAQTANLLRDANKPYRTRVNELLLTALVRTLVYQPGQKASKALVLLESHGRQTQFKDLDLSRTVGWFTAIFPLSLEIDPSEDMDHHIISIKEQLRAIPQLGFDYGILRYLQGADLNPDPESNHGVVFNYLGRIDIGLHQPPLLGFAQTDDASHQLHQSGMPAQKRPLVINAFVAQGQLQVMFNYHTQRFSPGAVQDLAQNYASQVQELISHCQRPGVGSFTPSDFPMAQLSASELHRLTIDSHIEDIYPVTAVQHGLLLNSLYANSPGVYFGQFHWHFHGQLNPRAFQSAWEHLLARYPVLRTSFHWQGLAIPVQRVNTRVTLPFVYQDLQALPAHSQEAHIEAFCQADQQQGFQLDQAPLMRCALFQTDVEDWHFVWSHHHLPIDGWSTPILFRQWLSAYQSLEANQPAPAPELPDFKSYVSWLLAQDKAPAKQFWKEELAGFSHTTELPGEKHKQHSALHARFTAELDIHQTQQLQDFARDHHLTLSTVLQGAWALILARCAQIDDVVFGVTLAGRPAQLPGVEDMVGLFSTTVPARVQLPGHTHPIQWLQDLQQRHLGREANAYLPLVDIHSVSNLYGGSPLFDSLIAYQNYPMDSQAQPGPWEIRAFHATEKTNFPLTLIAWLRDGRLHLKADYQKDRFDIPRLHNTLDRLLPIAARFQDPIGSLGQLDLITASERAHVLDLCQGRQTSYDTQQTVHQLFERQVIRTPDSHALWIACHSADALTFQELDHYANQIAQLLIEKGLEVDTPVGICMPSSPQMVACVLGVLKAGGAYLPLDPTYPVSRLRYMLADSKASCLIVESAAQASIFPDYKEVLISLPRRTEATTTKPTRKVDPANAAYIIYTSGSSGQPKGAIGDHRAYVNRLEWMWQTYPFRPGERGCLKTSLSFLDSAWEIFGPLCQGVSVVVIPSGHVTEPHRFVEALAQEGVTRLVLVPSLLRVLLDLYPDLNGRIPKLGFWVTSGEALPADLALIFSQKMPHAQLLNLYGSSEVAADATAAAAKVVEQSIPIGRPLDNVNVYILDQALRLTPPGLRGEIYIAGRAPGRGYYRRPGYTASRFLPDPHSDQPGQRLYRTGDVGRFLGDGQLQYLGRADRQVKVRGYRIELGEIEAAIASHPSVKQAIVITQTHQDQRHLVAFIVPTTNSFQPKTQMRAFLADLLPDYMQPQRYVSLDKLPLTPSGKVDFQSLIAFNPMVLSSPETHEADDIQAFITQVWTEIVQPEPFGPDDNFFEIGGNSLHLMRINERIRQHFQRELSIPEMFRYPTVRSLADFIRGHKLQRQNSPQASQQQSPINADIAIVGMALRTPSANDPQSFWEMLINGLEGLGDLSDEDLLKAGADPAWLKDPHYVKRGGVLEDVTAFDAEFFGFSNREAGVTDPQQRLFLEAAWQALEHAGYAPNGLQERVGVYAGAAQSSWLPPRYGAVTNGAQRFAEVIGNGLGFLASRLGYKLNLQGPCVSVQTACSTSLVAVHMACQALRQGDCEIALAGAVSIGFPQGLGYHFQEQMIQSPDGHCRPYDQAAAGTVGSDGLGIVVLKPLQAAIADRDTIYAMIKGSAINNDGHHKPGYTAPGPEGQAQVIQAALANAAVSPQSIGYVEGHGTGTSLGDPVEVEALNQAFDGCAEMSISLGSVKANIGHLNTAAGVVGLIKTALALHHKQIPPALHFQLANENIPFENSPFFVNPEAQVWESDVDSPRRAGVSSFGIGGTNAHVILQEAPESTIVEAPEEAHLLLFSARTKDQLAAMRKNLNEQGQQPLADIAYTLQVGRSRFPQRFFAIAKSRDDLSNLKDLQHGQKHFQGERPNIAFLFPGQGVPLLHAAEGYYRVQGSVFRKTLDQCAQMLLAHIGRDFRQDLYPAPGQEEAAQERLRQTVYAQPILFAVSYSLARQYLAWGIEPNALIGHSLGEYVAATVAHVFNLEDALDLIAYRGRLMASAQDGAMLAVSLGAEEVTDYLPVATYVAVDNGPSQVHISGSHKAIEALKESLDSQGIAARLMPTKAAFHSPLMEPIRQRLEERISRLKLGNPQYDIYTNLSGRRATIDIATPAYWGRQLCETVRFGEGLANFCERGPAILIELGPGNSLAAMARRHPAVDAMVLGAQSVSEGPHSQKHLSVLGKLWLNGIEADWNSLQTTPRQRIALPSYPFDRQSYVFKDEVPTPKKQVVERSSQLRGSDHPWQAVHKAADLQAGSGAPFFKDEGYLTGKAAIDQLCLAYMCQTLLRLGIFQQVGDEVSRSQIQTDFQIVPRFVQVALAFLDLLTDRGYLKKIEDRYRLMKAIDGFEVPTLLEKVEQLWPDEPQRIGSLRRCGSNLVAVLRGQQEPLPLIYAEDDFDAEAEALLPQRRYNTTDYYNGILAAATRDLIANLPQDRHLRVLEAGAGSGISTREILPLLPKERTHYIFTDVGKLFLKQAAQDFAAYPFLEYRLLDMEKDPTTQGFAEHQADLVVAANVLHVVRNLRETLRHLRSLMAPGGLLLAWEITRPRLEFAVTSGLIMNPVSDDRNQAVPFHSPQGWAEALRDSGFETVGHYPQNEDADYHILIAKADDSPTSSPQAFSKTIATTSKEPKASERVEDLSDWFYEPSYRRSPLPPVPATGLRDYAHDSCWLIFLDELGFGLRLASQLTQEGAEVFTVAIGDDYRYLGDREFELHPNRDEHYTQLLQELHKRQRKPRRIIHLWNLAETDEASPSVERYRHWLMRGSESIHSLVRSLNGTLLPSSSSDKAHRFKLWAVGNQILEISGHEALVPEKALVHGPLALIPMEFPNITAQLVDVELPLEKDWPQLITQILQECACHTSEPVVGLRGRHRWSRSINRLRLPAAQTQAMPIKAKGIYLITGGLGGIAQILARYLIETYQAEVHLLGRTKLPANEEWPGLNQDHPQMDRIKAVEDLKKLGEVSYHAVDITDRNALDQLLNQIQAEGQQIDGIIHAAAVPSRDMIDGPIKSPEDTNLAPKVVGSLVLDVLMKEHQIPLMIYCSSIAPYLPRFGLTYYVGSNAFLDTMAVYRQAHPESGPRILSINWNRWEQIGLAGDFAKEYPQVAAVIANEGMNPQEGTEVFERILASGRDQVMVFTHDLGQQHQKLLDHLSAWIHEQAPERGKARPRPNLSQDYVKPNDATEETIAQVWADILDIEKVGALDNFFELGGDSLYGVQMIHALNAQLGGKLPLSTLFEAPTVTLLADVYRMDGPNEQQAESVNMRKERGEKRRQMTNRRRKRD